ncbi:6-phospho-3-hexuloisomerase [Archaeoglobus profundus]|uniref:6-phospho 3-hexuloisomerase n=1 Tax=Archaeoglobus profundus (strain DSM 5631 / JCM 9629 / NBRC 100127 / Av18) TaxID=572546 RepID=D2RHI3_ARCPA|nr:6-phospho 3-hexuloisomerase [Archaeoglobus profundus DSM 5631]
MTSRCGSEYKSKFSSILAQGGSQVVGETLIRFLDKVCEHVQNIKSNLDFKKIEEFISALENARCIFVMGAGRSGFVAKAFAMRLMHLGYNVYVVGETVTPRIKPEDLLIAISGSGETLSVVNISRRAKEDIGSKLVAITQRPESTLAKMSDIVIVLKGKDKYERNHELSKLAPLGTLFELTALIFLDGLVAEIMNLKQLTEEDLAERHAVLE